MVMKVTQQFALIATAAHKDAKRGRVYAIPLLSADAAQKAGDILKEARKAFPGESNKGYFLWTSEKLRKTHVSFKNEKIARHVARKLRWQGHGLAVFELNPAQKDPQKSLKSYAVSVTPHRHMM